MADRATHAAPDGGACLDGAALLEQAVGLIARRRCAYGKPAPLFEHIAKRWSPTLGSAVSPAQVMLCLSDLKLARLAHNPAHADSQLDLAGYAAVVREVTCDG